MPLPSRSANELASPDPGGAIAGPRSLLPGDERGETPGNFLPTVSLVEQTMAEARRALFLVLAGAVLLLLGLLTERWVFTEAQQAAAARHAEAQRLAYAMRLVDLQRNTAAQMAVLTGQRSWVDRFDASVPEFDRLVAQARVLAPPAVTARFDAVTASATGDLEDMRESAFEAVAVHAADTARQIFEGERYRQKTAALERAIADFTGAIVDATRQEMSDLRRRNAGIGIALLLVAVAMSALLWRRLARSREHFLHAEDRVKHLAASDVLTGLPNRAALHDAMAAAMSQAQRSGARLAVLMIDLDRFKPVNDRHGHMVGDQVLKEVALRLRRVLRGGEVCARYGGDEFVVLVRDDGQPSAAHHLAERISRRLAEPIDLGAHTVGIGATVGIACFPDDGLDADELLRKADSALYRGKARARGGACYYDVSLDELVAERAALEQAVREGIARGEFIAHCQPIVDLSTRRVQSVELLARWQHPQRGLLAPAHFIALAEESGLIGTLMLAVLDHACAEMHHLPAHWRVSVNVAPQQIQDETLVPQLLEVLARHRVPASRLDVELTESALVGDTAAAGRVMLAMQEAGITVTLDDFGTGYSSLSYLADLAFDKLKIDRSFVHTLREHPQSAKVVDAIIGLSRSLGVQTVAEGIETEADAERLQRMGCTLGQGYLFGRPVPAQVLAQAAGHGPGPAVEIAASGASDRAGQPASLPA